MKFAGNPHLALIGANTQKAKPSCYLLECMPRTKKPELDTNPKYPHSELGVVNLVTLNKGLMVNVIKNFNADTDIGIVGLATLNKGLMVNTIKNISVPNDLGIVNLSTLNKGLMVNTIKNMDIPYDLGVVGLSTLNNGLMAKKGN